MSDNKTGTLYREDYSDYGWWYILMELGLMEEDHQNLPVFANMLDYLNDKDTQTFVETDEIQVKLADQ